MTSNAIDTLQTSANNPNFCIRVWLGGSFDPIHIGHLQMIQHVYQLLCHTFSTATVIAKLLPTAGSPLKQQPTLTADRFAMLQLAIQSLPFLSIDSFELQQKPPVYSYDTFSHFKAVYPDDILIFILGEDSLRQLNQWYQGLALINLTNLWVLPRPALTIDKVKDNGIKPPLAITQLTQPSAMFAQNDLLTAMDERLKSRLIYSVKDLINQRTNHIYIDDYVVPDIASRDIRQWLANGTASQQQLALANLPMGVYDYIVTHGLYGK